MVVWTDSKLPVICLSDTKAKGICKNEKQLHVCAVCGT